MQSVSDDDVRKRLLEQTRFELAAKGVFRFRWKARAGGGEILAQQNFWRTLLYHSHFKPHLSSWTGNIKRPPVAQITGRSIRQE